MFSKYAHIQSIREIWIPHRTVSLCVTFPSSSRIIQFLQGIENAILARHDEKLKIAIFREISNSRQTVNNGPITHVHMIKLNFCLKC